MKRAYLLDPIAVCTLVQFMKLLFRHEEIKYYQRYEEYNKCHKHLDSRMSALLLLWGSWSCPGNSILWATLLFT